MNGSGVGNVLDSGFVDVSELKEKLFDLAQGLNLDIFNLPVQEFLGYFLL